MNKLFIVLLAVCLVSVHAFVKRDAEEASNAATGADIQKQVQDIINTIGAKISESLSPEQLKKNFNNVVDEVQKSLNQLKANSEAAKN
ncbi:unnamed protein product, partial [Iphiclides podalirius]